MRTLQSLLQSPETRWMRWLPVVLPIGGVLNHLLGMVQGDAFFVPGNFAFHLSTFLFDLVLVAILLSGRIWAFWFGVCFYLFQIGLQSTRAILVMMGRSELNLAIQVLAVAFVALTLTILVQSFETYVKAEERSRRREWKAIAVSALSVAAFAAIRPML